MHGNDITVGLIGSGGIANAHLPAWLSLGADVVVFSHDANVEGFVAKHGGGCVRATLEGVLDAADIVDVCTPTFTHREIVERAAAAGCHVVCEKPLGLSTADAEAMRDACAAAGVRLLPAHIVRYFPEYAPMHEAVVAGRVGTLAVQRFTRIGSRPPKPWFFDAELSGGIVLDQMIHDIDFARWNAGDVAEVFARLVDRDGVTAAQVFLTHESDAISSLYGAWAPPGTTFRTHYMVAGDAGYLEHDSAARSPVAFNVPADQATQGGLLPALGDNESPFLTELRDFLSAIVSGRPARVSAEDGISAIAIAEAAKESLRTGRAATVGARPAGSMA